MTVINALALKPRFKTGFSPPASVSALDELFVLKCHLSAPVTQTLPVASMPAERVLAADKASFD